jgi:hypothetical protein
MGYTESETMALNAAELVDEASMPPLQFAVPGGVFAKQLPSYSGQWTVARSSSLRSSHIYGHSGDYYRV